jgi:hypothetical protein
MKITGMIGTGILSLLIATAAPVYAQHEQKDENRGHSDQKEAKHDQAKPEQHGQQQRSEQHQQPQHADQQQRHDQPQQHAQQPQRAQQHEQDQHAKQQRMPQQRQGQNNQREWEHQQGRNAPEQHRIQQSAWQQHRSQRWETDHRNWRQRGGYHGYRVPEDRFRGRFGPEHAFRIYGLPFMVYRGYPRFQYGGYWITAVDPWPEYWGTGWYDNDDVYVSYVDDGYYLYNRRYPTVGIAIRISM